MLVVTRMARGRMANARILAAQYPSRDILLLTVLRVSQLQTVLSKISSSFYKTSFNFSSKSVKRMNTGHAQRGATRGKEAP